MARPGLYRRSNEATQRLLDYAEEKGWQYELSRGGHIKFTKPGCPSVFTSATASDYRAAKNCISVLRRYQEACG